MNFHANYKNARYLFARNYLLVPMVLCYVNWHGVNKVDEAYRQSGLQADDPRSPSLNSPSIRYEIRVTNELLSRSREFYMYIQVSLTRTVTRKFTIAADTYATMHTV